MNFSSRHFAFLATVPLLIPSPAVGQRVPQGIEIVERVVAVVGDSAILMTEVEEFLLTMEASGWARPTGAVELLEARLDVVNQMVNQYLVVQEAALDTLLEISEEELEDRVQQEIDGQLMTFGTLGRLQDALAEQNMTLAVYRERQKNLIRRQLLQERYFAKRGQSAAGIVVTEEEARRYYEENPGLFPQRPPMIRFESIQLEPDPNDDAKAVALAAADSILSLLLNGEDFEDLAARFSDGPTASVGGELGWVREDGGLVPEFEEVVFQLGAGMISNPVETDFGYHIILVERIRGGERRVRHILFEPEITDVDVEANDRRAEEYVARLKAGETMADLGLEPDTFELSLEQIGQGSPALGTGMRDVEVGDVVGPVRMVGSTAANGWTVAKVLGKTEGGPGEFSDFRDLIEDRLRTQGLTDTVIEELRARSYIDIRLGADRP